MSIKTGHIYLLLSDNEDEDIIIGIKTKRKMLKLIWETNISREEKKIDFRMISIKDKNQVEISEQIHSQSDLTFIEKLKRIKK